MIERFEHKVDWCEVCGQGWVEIKRNSISKDINFRCSECFVEYDSYEHINKKTLHGKVDYSPISLTEQEIIVEFGY
ncbi:hypothetical protein [Paenibacillus sp. NPDC057967]|uniref:hypothetical protein n=1 Tax=Paenibacillus sp. NPDC057967 TaxID=3346293 RepID=UPI0036D8A5D3